MAGIGFSLKRLFQKKGIWNLCKAYGYAGIVTAGPMLLGVLLLFGIAFIASMGGMETHDRELLNCMITYNLLASLGVTSWFHMPVTRFISDSLYEEKDEKVIPSFFGAAAILLGLCFLLYGTFLHFAGITVLQQLLCLWMTLILIVVWMEVIYMTAIKDYKSIVLSFAIAIMIGFLLSLIFLLLGDITIEALLLCVIMAYGILAIRYFKLLLDYFPVSAGSHFSFLKWFDRYKSLAFAGGLLHMGLFGHFIVMYFGPLHMQVQGLFYGAPQYDVPALIAVFSFLVTTVSFVTSVEVKFYPKYRNYYGLFNDCGAIRDIQLAEREMRVVLKRELTYLGHKQLFATILFIVLVPPVLQKLMPGISSLSLAIFRFLCVGYATYALANSMMLILLYFEDYKGALIGTALFGICSNLATVWQIRFSDKAFFGMGLFVGAILFYAFTALRLSWFTRRLPYHLLSRQSILPKGETGFLAMAGRRLDERWEAAEQRKKNEIREKLHKSMKREGLK